MTGHRIPLFHRAKVIKKSAQESEASAEKVAQPAVAVAKKSAQESEASPTEERPRLFSTKRLKSIAQKLPRSEILDLTEDLPSTTISSQEASKDGSERVRKDYVAIRDPLEIHGAVARYLIKALNAIHALARRADLLDEAPVDAIEKERAIDLQVAELKRENDRLKVVVTLVVKEKKEATAQTLAEIKKHDLIQARFTRLEGEHFDNCNKFQRLELVHSQMTKKLSELEQRDKDVEEALP
ncbi:hypothetical protein LIER_29601 [Lithospermum erythrorhizon]|uniref:Uncharacterized protein n=1 Tax=Lithospermum erythrorhizon TaxID=34254 RepID=A0AAV3RN82_LITER